MVLLCLSLYCAMSVWGNGPSRTERYARSSVSGPATDGIVVLPAPAQPIAAQPIPARIVRAAAKAVPQRIDGVPVPAGGSATDGAVGDRGAVPATKLAAGPATEPDSLPANVKLGWIAASTANVRSGPNKRSSLAGKIASGGAVHILWAEPNGWVRIKAVEGGASGFVHKSLLTGIAPNGSATGTVEMATAD